MQAPQKSYKMVFQVQIKHREGNQGDGYDDITVESDDAEIGIVIEVEYAEKTRLDNRCSILQNIHAPKWAAFAHFVCSN